MTNYKLNDAKMFADVTDGVAIIINAETGIYYGLNELGTVVYQNIVDGASVEDILTALTAVEDSKDAKTSLDNFIQVMLDNEIFVPADSSSKKVSIDENIIKECAFELNIKAYTDAQEMLLTDPIHEIKEDTGWSPETDSIGYSKQETVEREKKMEEDN